MCKPDSGHFHGASGSTQYEKEILFAELDANGVKYTKENVLFIARDATGQIVWLDDGSFVVEDEETERVKKSLTRQPRVQLEQRADDCRFVVQNFFEAVSGRNCAVVFFVRVTKFLRHGKFVVQIGKRRLRIIFSRVQNFLRRRFD